MLASIHLNRQLGFDAGEVQKVSAQWVLATESDMFEMGAAQTAPERAFGVGEVGSQMSREGALLGF